jgi:hypothetical protein
LAAEVLTSLQSVGGEVLTSLQRALGDLPKA